MRNLLKFIVAHVTHAQLNDINDIKKREREREKKDRKNEVSDTHKSFDDETLNTTGKISTR
jgi:hypothetical protein